MVINLDLDLNLNTVEYMSPLNLAAKTYREFQLFRRSIQEVRMLCRSRQYHMILDLELHHTHCGA